MSCGVGLPHHLTQIVCVFWQHVSEGNLGKSAHSSRQGIESFQFLLCSPPHVSFPWFSCSTFNGSERKSKPALQQRPLDKMNGSLRAYSACRTDPAVHRDLEERSVFLDIVVTEFRNQSNNDEPEAVNTAPALEVLPRVGVGSMVSLTHRRARNMLKRER